MRRKTPIAHQLFEHLFPHPTTNDPQSFPAHLARNLVPEVRLEVQTFYGDLNSVEARYPGLDYCYPPHRMRLGRFKHHRRLFQAFDDLKLTYTEIQDFCCWEGTKWARERYEKEEGITVQDTTGDEIGPFVDRRELRREEWTRRGSITRKTDIEVVVEDRRAIEEEEEEGEGDEEMSDADSEADDGEATAQDSVHEDAAYEQHLNELSRRRDLSITQRDTDYHRRILAAFEQGVAELPPELEAYLKEHSERGTLPMDLELSSILARSQPGRAYPRVRASSNASTSTTVVPRAAA